MLSVRKQTVSLFVDRISQRWIVRDPDGQFWVIPSGYEGWALREPLDPNGDFDLEPIPGHYRYLFDLPF
ncbi:MAG: hypothetical protein KF861_06485 [Planctomycetaceae bacterium]|nr:hypothetical protein [Planctomycetaceae bacterium]